MPATSEKTGRYLDVIHKISPQLEEIADRSEETGEFPWAAFELMNEHGLFKLTMPTEWGGEGMSASEYFPLMAEIAKISGVLRMLIHGQNGTWRMIHGFGTEEQKREWLPRQVAGAIFSMALTEPGGTGRGLATTAVLEGDEWVINGEKHLISFSQEAEVVHVIAATGRDETGGAIASAILVPKGTPGQIMTRMAPGMGCHGSTHYHITYENVRVPAANLLGTQGDGLEISLRCMLDISRVSIGYSALGLALRSFELAVEFAKQRVTLGQPIANRQAIRLAIGEMAADIYSVQAALADTCARFDEGRSITAEAAMTKLQALEMVGRVTDRALRIHGGVGYLKMHKIERHYRDARALWFEEGTAEIQKFVIADQILHHGHAL